MKYLIVPGCHSQGKTEREALTNIKDAILTYLDTERAELNCRYLAVFSNPSMVLKSRYHAAVDIHE